MAVWPRICSLVQLTCCSVLHYIDLLQCLAVRCNVLQSGARGAPLCNSPVAVCCSVLQYIAVWCSVVPTWLSLVQLNCFIVMQCVAVSCSVLQCGALCCSVLQCLAVSCSVLQCLAVCYSVVHCVAVSCSALQCLVHEVSPCATHLVQCVLV